MRLCCMANRIYSIPFRATYFAPGWYEEKDELNLEDMKNRPRAKYLAGQGIE